MVSEKSIGVFVGVFIVVLILISLILVISGLEFLPCQTAGNFPGAEYGDSICSLTHFVVPSFGASYILEASGIALLFLILILPSLIIAAIAAFVLRK